MARRMISPQMIIKSQIVDDKYIVDLNEILEKYGTLLDDDTKTITLQIYNKEIWEDEANSISTDDGIIGYIVVNGSITISKYDGDVYIKGMLLSYSDMDFIPYLEIPSGSYENIGIELADVYKFDVHVIRV